MGNGKILSYTQHFRFVLHGVDWLHILLFIEEAGYADPVTFIVNSKLYTNLFEQQAIPTLQQGACVDRIIFMQIDVLPHIVNLVMQLLKCHFGNERILCHHFPTACQDYRSSIFVTFRCEVILKYCVQGSNYKFSWL